LFDLAASVKQCAEIKDIVNDNSAAFNKELPPWINEIENKIAMLQTVAEKFRAQLNKLFSNEQLPEENSLLHQRLTSASSYFILQLEDILQFIATSPATTDSKQHAKAYNESLKELFALLSEKKHLMNCCESQFTIEKYYREKKNFVLTPFAVNAYVTASAQQKTE